MRNDRYDGNLRPRLWVTRRGQASYRARQVQCRENASSKCLILMRLFVGNETTLRNKATLMVLSKRFDGNPVISFKASGLPSVPGSPEREPHTLCETMAGAPYSCFQCVFSNAEFLRGLSGRAPYYVTQHEGHA